MVYPIVDMPYIDLVKVSPDVMAELRRIKRERGESPNQLLRRLLGLTRPVSKDGETGAKDGP